MRWDPGNRQGFLHWCSETSKVEQFELALRSVPSYVWPPDPMPEVRLLGSWDRLGSKLCAALGRDRPNPTKWVS